MLSSRGMGLRGPVACAANRRVVQAFGALPCVPAGRSGIAVAVLRQPARRMLITVASTQPDTEEARSPSDAPQEWEPPQPSRRPDIFPEFEKMERVFLPKPLPGDPEMPDEESEEAAKRTEPGDPDPEAPAGEPSEPEPKPGEGDPTSPERKDPSIPSAPE